ncbi:Mth938-like domain-containing protein [Thauera mechernichensis]|uniref:Mth938-like domain-containing protein n=1 Tax=Thauera mechernichensis TaxID=82788 RepID=A0ABW3WF37_9RHOO|nr:Mth938-like domain-containing protein [Thauera mechernichensis]MDG3064756.1 Mth938-like domain-containing protein [Thauera mechernichensis]
MKLYLDNLSSINVISGYGEDHVMVGKERHEGNLLLSANRIVTGWAPEARGSLEGLRAEDLAEAAGLGAEILIVGTGKRQRFPQPTLLRPLIEARIGFEFMDFAAACRTYNILVGESRAVALALIYES